MLCIRLGFYPNRLIFRRRGFVNNLDFTAIDDDNLFFGKTGEGAYGIRGGHVR